MDMHLNVLGMQLVYISNKYKLTSMALCTNNSTYSVDSHPLLSMRLNLSRGYHYLVRKSIFSIFLSSKALNEALTGGVF